MGVKESKNLWDTAGCKLKLYQEIVERVQTTANLVRLLKVKVGVLRPVQQPVVRLLGGARVSLDHLISQVMAAHINPVGNLHVGVKFIEGNQDQAGPPSLIARITHINPLRPPWK